MNGLNIKTEATDESSASSIPTALPSSARINTEETPLLHGKKPEASSSQLVTKVKQEPHFDDEIEKKSKQSAVAPMEDTHIKNTESHVNQTTDGIPVGVELEVRIKQEPIAEENHILPAKSSHTQTKPATIPTTQSCPKLMENVKTTSGANRERMPYKFVEETIIPQPDASILTNLEKTSKEITTITYPSSSKEKISSAESEHMMVTSLSTTNGQESGNCLLNSLKNSTSKQLPSETNIKTNFLQTIEEPHTSEETQPENAPTLEADTFSSSLTSNGADGYTKTSSEAEQSVRIKTELQLEDSPTSNVEEDILSTPKRPTIVKKQSQIASTTTAVSRTGEDGRSTPERPTGPLKSFESNAHSLEAEQSVRIKTEPQLEEPSTANVEEDGLSTPKRPPIVKKAAEKEYTTTAVLTTVKPEPISRSPDNIPEDYFDDLLENADQLTDGLFVPSPLPLAVDEDVASTSQEDQEATSCATNSSTIQLRQSNELSGTQRDDGSDLLANNFFDDLLIDHVTERSARIANEEREIKYSYQLESIRERLRQMDEDVEPKKKHKHKKSKSKKKSHKHRKRDEKEGNPSDEATITSSNQQLTEKRSKKRKRNDSNSKESVYSFAELTTQQNVTYGNLPKCLPTLGETSRLNVAGSSDKQIDANDDVVMQLPQPFLVESTFADVEEDFECLTLQQGYSSSSGNSVPFKRIKLEKSVITNPEPLVLTPPMKRQIALKLAAETLRKFEAARKNPQSGSFYFTSTVRKLPASSSMAAQQIFENRSPLHTINNVDYAFNSNCTRFNLQEWGLEALPKLVAKIAFILGYDADALLSKLHATKLTRKFTKIKKELDDYGESVDETKSSFFTNAMTQTDDVQVLGAGRRNVHEIGVQVKPNSGSISTQTTATGSNSANSNDDLPLMQLIKVLNENQLLALNDFAELINEPATTAMDMYRLRTRMLEIYKCSQLPSALPAQGSANISVPPSVFTAASNHSNRMEFLRNQNQYSAYNEYMRHAHSHPQQQQPPPFVIRDPRSVARSYADPRLIAVPLDAQQQLQRNSIPPKSDATKKGYGRGSSRH